MPSIALATTELPATDPDREILALVEELRARGADAVALDWWRPEIDWASFDLVLVKSPWDYPERLPEFLGWLRATAAKTRVRNDPALIEWNLDKIYLAELAARGVAIVPTTFCHTSAEVAEALRSLGAERVVIKPSVSAGSRNTGMFAVDDAAAVALAERILGIGKVVMVQPAIESVARTGERALLFFGGAFSHAVRKGPLLAPGGGLVSGDTYIEQMTADIAPDDELALASAAFAAAADACAQRGMTADQAAPTHARVDVARDGQDRPVIMELELFEPSWSADLAPGAVQRAADALMASLQ